MIAFTQQNEQEADRIGIQVLQRSGFDPEAMPGFLEKLLEQSRFSSRPPEMLLTHPLPENRVSDARNRAGQMNPVVVQSSQEFLLAKVRVLGMYASGRNQLTGELLDTLSKGSLREKNAANYGYALQALEAKNYADARQRAQTLLSANPGNVWYLDLLTDIDLGQKKSNEAIARLSAAKSLSHSPVLQLNLANAYLDAGRPKDAADLLNRYTFTHQDDPNGWDMLSRAQAGLGARDQELAARAESFALNGQLDEAMSVLKAAGSQVSLGSSQQARYDARIDQLRVLQQRFRAFEKK
jgi:predicted Zn-dependent protease